MQDVFAFGTLMYPEVLSSLLDSVPEMRSATLYGYRRCKISIPGREARGPAIITAPHQTVNGKILFGLSDRQMKILDLFEDAASGYRRAQGVVRTTDGNEVSVQFYEATDEIRPYLSNEDWSEEDFKKEYLSIYVTKRIPALKNSWKDSGELD